MHFLLSNVWVRFVADFGPVLMLFVGQFFTKLLCSFGAVYWAVLVLVSWAYCYGNFRTVCGWFLPCFYAVC